MDTDVKALSIQQPWAWLIVHGFKDVENRTWPTNERGTILIHAGKTVDGHGYRWILDDFPDLQMPPLHQMPRGGIVGMANLVDCVTKHESPWFFGPYGFVLSQARPRSFWPYSGRLGFFAIDVERMIREAPDVEFDGVAAR